MSPNLDNQLLRTSAHSKIRDYLQSLLEKYEAEEILSSLFRSVSIGSVPPSPTLFIFLSIADSPAALLAALRYPHSTGVRKAAIRALDKWFRRDEKFEKFWMLVGGAKGFVIIMAEASVLDVKGLCKMIGKAGLTPNCPVREAEITKLLVCLESLDYFPSDGGDGQATEGDQESLDSLLETNQGPVNPDKRSIDVYHKLSQACTPEFANWYYESGFAGVIMSSRTAHKLFEARPQAFHDHCLGKLFPDEGTGERLAKYRNAMRRSVDLAISCVSRLSESEKFLERDYARFIPDIAIPLVRQLYHRQAPHAKMEKAWSFVIPCLRKLKRKGLALESAGDEGRLTYYAAKFWNRFDDGDGGKAEKILCGLVNLLPAKSIDLHGIQIFKLLKAVGPPKRMKLLEILLEHTKQYEIKLQDQDTEAVNEKLQETKQSWAVYLFLTSLPCLDAIGLLERLGQALPKDHIIDHEHPWARDRSNIFGYEFAQKADANMLLVSLKSQSPDPNHRSSAVQTATELVGIWKQKSMEASDRHDRGERAATAIACAVLSGSVSLYHETLKWAHRFNKDPIVVPIIYGEWLESERDNIHLLTGIPDIRVLNTIPKCDLVSTIKSYVASGNDILALLAETATLLAREPHTEKHNWLYIFRLFELVPSRRLRRMRQVQDLLGLSDGQAWEAVMKPTLDILLYHEEHYVLSEQNKALGRWNASGIVRIWGGGKEAITVAGQRLRNEFVEKRSELWEKYRTKMRPAVATLQWPWPRGLPFQFMLPIAPRVHSPLPYLDKLAESVVFMDHGIATAPLPSDKETRQAIAYYVHGYLPCLELYVIAGKDRKEQEGRLIKAWNHATTQLVRDGEDELAAALFWRDIFRRCKEHAKLEIDIAPSLEIRNLSFPENRHNLSTPTEWYPDPITHHQQSDLSHSRPHHREPVIVDCIKSAHRYHRSLTEGGFVEPQPPPPLHSLPDLPSFYTLSQYRDQTCRTRDPLIAAAILSINAREGEDKSLLMEPFPSAKDRRFPALYLDRDFLECEDNYGFTQLRLLRECNSTVPAQVLERLATSLLKRMVKSPRDTDAPHMFMMVLERLARSDAPQYALPLVKHVILNRPQHSSWHRKILGRRFLRSLPHRAATLLVNDVTTALLAKLKLTARDEPSDDGGETAEQSSAVKISSVKMVAQLLIDNPDFLDPSLVMEILSHLLQESGHRDVWMAVLSGLKRIFMQAYYKEKRLEETILILLETVVVPRAASINEKMPPTEEDWNLANLPLVHDLDSEERYPMDYGAMARELLSWAKELIGDGMTPDLDDEIQHHDTSRDGERPDPSPFLTRVIFPMVRKSVDENGRWMRAFLKHWNLDSFLPDGSLPPIPVFPMVLENIIHHHGHFMPMAMYSVMHKYCMTLIDPSPGLVEVNKRIRETSAILDTNGGKHWLSIWYRPPSDIPGGGVINLGLSRAAEQLMCHRWDKEDERPKELTCEDIGRNTLEAFQAFMEQGDVEACYWLLDRMSSYNTFESRCYSRRSWEKVVVPLLEDAIALVEKKKTREWVQDPSREPSRLPDVLRIRAQNFLVGMDWSKADEGTVRQLAMDVGRIIDMVVDSGKPHPYYLMGQHPYTPNTPLFALRHTTPPHAGVVCQVLAGHIGADPNAAVNLNGYVRLEMACAPILGRISEEETDERAGQLLEQWMRCSDELVRDMVEATVMQARKYLNTDDPIYWTWRGL